MKIINAIALASVLVVACGSGLCRRAVAARQPDGRHRRFRGQGLGRGEEFRSAEHLASRRSPRTRSSKAQNNTVGAVRLLTLKGGGTDQGEAARVQSRRPHVPLRRSSRACLPVSDYTSILTVKSAGKGKSTVTWSGRFKRKNEGDTRPTTRTTRPRRTPSRGLSRQAWTTLKKNARGPVARCAERPRFLSSRGCRVVLADLRCADPGAGAGVAGDPVGAQCAGGRSDRIGQDLCGVPRRDRPARQGRDRGRAAR